MRVSYHLLRRFLPDLPLRPQEIPAVFLNQGFVVETVFPARDLFLGELFAGTLVEIQKEGVFTRCTVRVRSRTATVLVHPWGVPEAGSRVLVGIENGAFLFLPVRGEREREVVDFLVPLPPFLEEGDDVYEALVGDDTVFEVEVTANRGDCLSVLGLAREVAASCGIPLVLPEAHYPEKEIHHGFYLENQAPHLCPYYTGKYIATLRVRPSPFWIVRDLVLTGMRPINNVVDITNLVMAEMGQPLHAFDAARIKGKTVRIREAQENERIVTLDGEERMLQKGMLVIADASRPIAIAGVMGGRDTEVGPSTQAVFLEAALFDRVSVRRTARALGMRTEASARFERGVDPLGVLRGVSRALALLVKEGQAEIAADWLVSGQPPVAEREIRVPVGLVTQRLSCAVSPEKSVRILEGLGFQVAFEDEVLSIRVPSWRSDVREAIDVVEEIGRVFGYENILSSFPSFTFDPGDVPRKERLTTSVRRHLVHRGLYEAITLSLVSEDEVRILGIEDVARVLNPLSQDHVVLRPSLFPGLFGVVQVNARRGRRSPGFFEVGRTFFLGENELREEERLGVLLWNAPQSSLWRRAPWDIFALKGILEELGEIAGLSPRDLECTERVSPFLEHGEAFLVRVRKEAQALLGFGGKVRSSLLREHDVEGELYYLELSLELLEKTSLSFVSSPGKFVLPSFPAVTRDVAVVVDTATPWSFVASCVEEVAERHSMALEEFVLFDVFSGNPLPPGKKGFAFRLIFRAPDRTLAEEEVATWVRVLKEGLKQTGKVILREEMTFPHE